MSYNHGDIWPDVRAALYNKYNVIDWVDILDNDFDLNPKMLFKRLLPYSNANFEYDQRLVIYHKDTDFYYSNDAPGFLMYNLYRIIQQLNIPSEYVILLCAYPNIEYESNKLSAECNVPPVNVIYCPYQWCPLPEEVDPIDLNVEKIKKSYICLNGQPRVHRAYTMCLLKEYNIFDQGIISFNSFQVATSKKDCGNTHNKNSFSTYNKNSNNIDQLVTIPQNLKFCQTDPPTRINEKLFLSQEQWKIIEKWQFNLTPTKSTEILGNPNDNKTRYQAEFLQYPLWNLVLETVGDYPHTFITEKTIKSILTKRPFVILGGVSPINHLKSLGFKTFSRWIDESYDHLPTFADRSNSCVKQLVPYCKMTTQDLQNVALEMQEILEYNFYHYLNVFGKQQLEHFIKFKL